MQCAIIFGANGQDGFYLTQHLIEQGLKVKCVGRYGSYSANQDLITHVDISDYKHVSDLIKSVNPDFIFHFAANSTTNHNALLENHQTISTGTLNILESVRNHSPHAKVFISGSGLQFLNNGIAIKETDQFEARDAYSISRIQSVYAARYFLRLGIKVYVGYLFNHDSPLRTERHMSKKISEAAKRISIGSHEKLHIGDINVVKEWTYAGDVIKAIWLFMQQESIFEANIGSGLGYSIKDWLDSCFKIIGKDWGSHIVLSEKFQPDYRVLVSDPTSIFSLGWTPSVSFDELALMMVNI
jgi:GDPmannose 4,6-dehydratase